MHRETTLIIENEQNKTTTNNFMKYIIKKEYNRITMNNFM